MTNMSIRNIKWAFLSQLPRKIKVSIGRSKITVSEPEPGKRQKYLWASGAWKWAFSSQGLGNAEQHFGHMIQNEWASLSEVPEMSFKSFEFDWWERIASWIFLNAVPRGTKIIKGTINTKNTKGVPNPRFGDFERMENIWNANFKRFRGTQNIWNACFESPEAPKASETANHTFREIRMRRRPPKCAFSLVRRHQIILTPPKHTFREVRRLRTLPKRALWPIRKRQMHPKHAVLKTWRHRTPLKCAFREAWRPTRLETPTKKTHKVCVQIKKACENAMFLQCFEKTHKFEPKRMWKNKGLWRGRGNVKNVWKRDVFNTFLKSEHAKTTKKQTRNPNLVVRKTR